MREDGSGRPYRLRPDLVGSPVVPEMGHRTTDRTRRDLSQLSPSLVLPVNRTLGTKTLSDRPTKDGSYGSRRDPLSLRKGTVSGVYPHRSSWKDLGGYRRFKERPERTEKGGKCLPWGPVDRNGSTKTSNHGRTLDRWSNRRREGDRSEGYPDPKDLTPDRWGKG